MYDADIREMLLDFTYEHLEKHRPDLAELSKPFCDMAHSLVQLYPPDFKLLSALDDLMKAKDSALRLQVAEKRRQRL